MLCSSRWALRILSLFCLFWLFLVLPVASPPRKHDLVAYPSCPRLGVFFVSSALWSSVARYSDCFSGYSVLSFFLFFPSLPLSFVSFSLLFIYVPTCCGLLFTGGHSNQDPRCTQKPIYTRIFTHHIRSWLICTPVNRLCLSSCPLRTIAWCTWHGIVVFVLYCITMRFLCRSFVTIELVSLLYLRWRINADTG